jgi:hypothetical protein
MSRSAQKILSLLSFLLTRDNRYSKFPMKSRDLDQTRDEGDIKH